MVDFAVDWLADLFGSRRQEGDPAQTQATRWNDEPWALGAFSAAARGGQPGAAC